MRGKKNKKLVSIVVPAYKKEANIKKDLESIDRTLKEGLGSNYNHEIICVVDGSPDRTEEEARKVKSERVRVFSYKNNRGKGYAVRYGMKKTKGDLVSFLDAGMEYPPKGVMMLMAHMEWYDADVIVGSKRHPVSRVNYPILRRILSVGYHFGVKVLFGIPITDTQSGIKIFKRKVVEKVLPRLLVKRYAMDIEMLAVAKRLGFKRIYEAPVELSFNEDTSTIDWSTILKMFWDTLSVFYRLKILRFYDDGNWKRS